MEFPQMARTHSSLVGSDGLSYRCSWYTVVTCTKPPAIAALVYPCPSPHKFQIMTHNSGSSPSIQGNREILLGVIKPSASPLKDVPGTHSVPILREACPSEKAKGQFTSSLVLPACNVPDTSLAHARTKSICVLGLVCFMISLSSYLCCEHIISSKCRNDIEG